MYPILYDKFTADLRNLTHFGLGILADAISCVVTEELNGVFELEMKYPTNGALFDQLSVEHLLKVDVSLALKNQLFIIDRIDTSMNGFVVVYAEHISCLLRNIPLSPAVNLQNVNVQVALDELSRSVNANHDFNFTSNINKTGSLEFDLRTHSNLRDALSSILAVWGGEFTFNNFDVSLNQRRGVRANTVIEYGRNLLDLAQEQNIAETATSIYPFAIHRQSGYEDLIVTVPELIIDAPNAEHFANRRVVSVDFSREFGRDEVPTVESLRELASQYMVDNGFGVPQVAITLRFVDLSKMAGGNALEVVNLGDTVPVRFNQLGIELNDSDAAKVVRVRWNVLMEQYDEIDLGTIRRSFSGQFNQVSARVGTGGTGGVGLGVAEIPELVVSDTEPSLETGKLWIETVDNGIPLVVNLYVNNGIAWRQLELECFGSIRKEVDELRLKIKKILKEENIYE